MGRAKSKIEIRNKKASFEYEFLETYTAGIVLTGTEIKSIRAGKASLVDSWCYFAGGELYVKNMHIAEYWWGTFNRHDPTAMPSSTSPSPEAKRNTTSASPSKRRTCAVTQSNKPVRQLIYFVRVTVWSTLPSLSSMCRLRESAETVTRDQPDSGLQKTVPSIGSTSRLREPEELTT